MQEFRRTVYEFNADKNTPGKLYSSRFTKGPRPPFFTDEMLPLFKRYYSIGIIHMPNNGKQVVVIIFEFSKI